MSEDKITQLKINKEISFINDLLFYGTRQLCCFVANGKQGILPHDIADGSLLFGDTNEKYKIGDYIIINEIRNGKKGFRIVKALSENEENFMCKIILTTKIFSKDI